LDLAAPTPRSFSGAGSECDRSCPAQVIPRPRSLRPKDLNFRMAQCLSPCTNRPK
jgi:hypothetical protein